MRTGPIILSVLLVISFSLLAVADEPEPSVVLMSATGTPEKPIPSLKTTDQDFTMAEALSLALKHNPTLAVYSEEIRAKDAAALQAGLLSNPELTVGMDNFAGENDLEGINGAETTVAITQMIELGGKRSKRRQLAVIVKNLADWDYKTQKIDILAETARAFIQLLAAQERLLQNQELVTLSEQTFNAVADRVEAGKVSPVEQVRAQVELAAARTEAEKAHREQESARSRLVSFWGEEHRSFEQVVGKLTEIFPLPSEADLQDHLPENPDLARSTSELEYGEAAQALARSQSIPDMAISFGVRNFQESDGNALVAGIGLPLPLFNRNQGGIAEAGANREKIRRERRAAEIEVKTRLSESWQNLAAAHAETTTLRDQILPGARSAFEAVKFGYSEGKFDFLQMLDAQRTLFEVKGQYLASLLTYHLARVDVERLIGNPPQPLSPDTTQTMSQTEVKK